MVIMSPGYFPDTYFPDRYLINDYWANYGDTEITGVIRGLITYEDLNEGKITHTDPNEGMITYL